MSRDIISSISQYLTPETITRISSALDLERAAVEKAIGASIPGILTGLASLVAKPEGARQLASAVENQPDAVLETLTNVVGRSRQGAFIENGTNALSSLLGDGALGILAGAVSRFAGFARGSAKNLLGLLAPVVLGFLGQEKRDAGLDTYGLARLLEAQKDQLAAAMPGGFSNLLQTSGFFDRIHAASVPPTVGAAVRMSTASLGHAARAIRSDASYARSAYWVLPLLALGGLAWFFLTGRPTGQQVSESQRTTTAAEAVQAGASFTVGGVEVGRQAVAMIDSISTSLQGVKDTTSATAALPKLQQLIDELERLGSLSNYLPAENRNTLAKFMKAFMPEFNSTIDSLATIPGVMPIVKPTVDLLRVKLDTLATAEGSNR